MPALLPQKKGKGCKQLKIQFVRIRLKKPILEVKGNSIIFSSMSHKQVLSAEALKVFESVPDLYLILSPDLNILTASDVYLAATLSTRDSIVGKYIFEAFPDNPDLPEANSVNNLHASLQKVLETRKPHQMALQRYDVPGPAGKFEVKYWDPVNTPVLNEQGEILYIIHKVKEVTERVKAQKQIQELTVREQEALLQVDWEQKKRSIFMQAPVGIAIFENEDYVIDLVNPRMCEMLGHEASELKGKPLFEVMPEFKGQGFESILAEVFRTGKFFEAKEISASLKKGDKLVKGYYNLVYQPLYNSHQEVTGIIQISIDVTEQVKSRHDIEGRENQLRLITDSLPVLIGYLDKEEKYRFANKAYEEWFPLKAEDLLGQPVREVVGEKAYQGVKKYIDRALAGDRLSFSAEMPYREGFTKYIRTSYVPDIQDGQVAGFYTLVSDVTEQELSRQRIEESEQKYRSLFETMEQGFCIMEMIFDEKNRPVDYRLLEVNPTFEEQTGLRDAQGRTARELVPDLEAHWFEIYGKVALTGEPAHITQGSEAMGRWFDINAFRLGGSGSKKVALLFTDISQRKEVEESLKRSNHWFKLVNQATQDTIWDWDLKSNQVNWNEGVHRMFHYKPEEVEHTSIWWYEHVHPEDRQRVVEGIHEIIASDKDHWSAEYRFLTGDGGYKIVFDRGFVIHNGNGEPTRMIGSMQDITERKRAEEALKESESRLRGIVETTPDCIKIVDDEGTLVFINQAGLHMTESESTESIIGTSFYEFIAPEDRKRWKETHQRVCQGESLNWEYSMIGYNGTRLWMETHAVPLENPDGSCAQLAIARDISDRIKSERALKESEERLSRVIEGSNDGIWDWEFKNDRAWWNQRFNEIMGAEIPESERSLIKVNKFIHPDDRHLIPEALKAHLEQGEKFEVEYRINHPSGEIRHILSKGKAIRNEQGDVTMMSGTITDFTDRKRAEDHIKMKNEQLTRINNDLDNFIYTASHDLKAPILNIEGLVNLLNKSFLPDTKNQEKIKTIMGMIDTSIARFKETIKDLAEVAKVQSSAEEEVEEISFESILEEVKLNIKSLIDESDVHIEADFSQLPIIQFSKKNLRSIMYNLVSNAIKYRSPDRSPYIKITTSRPDKEHLLLSVQDNGVGIKEKDKEKVFMMFKRLNQQVEGTGIGMAIVKKIAENSGGKIELDSEYGKGSTFKVYFRG